MGGFTVRGIISTSPTYIFVGDFFMNKNKKDYLLHTLFFQFLVCGISFGVLFGIKYTGLSAFESIKIAYFDNLNRNYAVDLKEKGQEVFKNSALSETENPTQVSSSDTTVATTKTQATEALTEELTAKIKAEGGADYSVSSLDEIPDNVSVDSYTLSHKMFLPATGEITSPFGVRTHPIDGDLRFHAGVDIADETGTPIYSAFDGAVLVSDYDQWNGYYLKVIHDNEIMTVYCHCNKLLVKKGDIVKAGQKIAEMGSTGSSTGPHLHFELRINNKSYDPQSALNEAISEI